MMRMSAVSNRPTAAFIGASWVALLVGSVFYCIGLWNTTMNLHEKGYYLTIILYGLFAAVSLQKAVRDQIENIPVTAIYFGLCWFSVISSIVLLSVGLWNAELALSARVFISCPFCWRCLVRLQYKKIFVMCCSMSSKIPSLIQHHCTVIKTHPVISYPIGN
jgi:uncharacterized membrane protein YiaA